MRKNVIRLTESEFHGLIMESVKRIVNEMNELQGGELDSAELDTQNEIQGWIDVMTEQIFDAQDVEGDDRGGSFTTQDNQYNHTLNIEYNVVDYGNPEQGIECDVTAIDGESLINVSPDVIDEVTDFLYDVTSQNNFFEADFNYESNRNFIRFRLVAPY